MGPLGGSGAHPHRPGTACARNVQAGLIAARARATPPPCPRGGLKGFNPPMRLRRVHIERVRKVFLDVLIIRFVAPL